MRRRRWMRWVLAGLCPAVWLVAGCVRETDPETACDDGIDNDLDGLYDCDDPDCAGVGRCDGGDDDTSTDDDDTATDDDDSAAGDDDDSATGDDDDSATGDDDDSAAGDDDDSATGDDDDSAARGRRLGG